jgi:hypothetical protein
MKASSDLAWWWHEPIEFHIRQPSTYGLVLKYAITEPPRPFPQSFGSGSFFVEATGSLKIFWRSSLMFHEEYWGSNRFIAMIGAKLLHSIVL